MVTLQYQLNKESPLAQCRSDLKKIKILTRHKVQSGGESFSQLCTNEDDLVCISFIAVTDLHFRVIILSILNCFEHVVLICYLLVTRLFNMSSAQ